MKILPKPFDPANPLTGGTFGAFLKIIFALIVVMGMILSLLGAREQGMIVWVTVTLFWVCTRIINEGIAALMTILSKKEKDGNDKG